MGHPSQSNPLLRLCSERWSVPWTGATNWPARLSNLCSQSQKSRHMRTQNASMAHTSQWQDTNALTGNEVALRAPPWTHQPSQRAHY
eukprot:UN3593